MPKFFFIFTQCLLYGFKKIINFEGNKTENLFLTN